ncbi:MAG: hypothetical protein L0387_26615, partial [Acidobacteria bacterium]|nr:hypothetical protein [Acidobacteriota bacterium]MCI0625173.1 hypothetical protein [Acidobacteriota bacterium]MCI0722570.1 hypothetical protein [Acidobacteriota bacterium]
PHPMKASQAFILFPRWGEGNRGRLRFSIDNEFRLYSAILSKCNYCGYPDAHQALQAFRTDPHSFDAVLSGLTGSDPSSPDNEDG